MVEYASGLTVFCQSSQIAQLVEVLALISSLTSRCHAALLRKQRFSLALS